MNTVYIEPHHGKWCIKTVYDKYNDLDKYFMNIRGNTYVETFTNRI